MKTKIIEGTVHFKRKRFIFVQGEVNKLKQITGRIRIVYSHGNTYVVMPYLTNEWDPLRYSGLLIPIIEDYDSLE